MKNYNQKSEFDNCFDLPNPGLRSHFYRVRLGNEEEYRTPFYKGKSLQEILGLWSKILEPIRESWPTLWDFENDLREKVGPMSIMKPLSQRMEDIDSYYESILLDSKPIDKRAIEALLAEWDGLVNGLSLRSPQNTVNNMKLSSNSGSPFYDSSRRNVLPKMNLHQLKVFPQGRSVVQDLGPSKWNAAAILGWRGQEGGPEDDDVKQRVIWMFPFAVNIEELRLYQVLIEQCQKYGYVPAWIGMDAVDARITQLFDTKAKDDLVICTDFSKFDQHFNDDMQECAKTFYSRCGVDYDWLELVFPIKYMIPLAYEWDKVRFGRHGMGSGSGGTNADETVTHRCLQHEAAILNGSKLNPNSQCLGDDGILSYPGCSVEDVMRVYTAHGQVMNADKQYSSTQDCVYLRRWHHQNYRVDGRCVGVYSTFRALGRLCEQERFYDPKKWSKEMVTLRYLSILENCKYHPLREKFADFCIKGDKYRLGLKLPGFLDKIETVAKKAREEMPDFMGYTKSLEIRGDDIGISNWWIVKYLKSKK